MGYNIVVPSKRLWYLDRVSAYLNFPGDIIERRRKAFTAAMSFSGTITESLTQSSGILGLYEKNTGSFEKAPIYPFSTNNKNDNSRVNQLRLVLERTIPLRYDLEHDITFTLDSSSTQTFRRHMKFLRGKTECFEREDFVAASLQLATISMYTEIGEEKIPAVLGDKKIDVFTLKRVA